MGLDDNPLLWYNWFFSRHTLRKKYKENIDFKEIKADDDLVKIYESLNEDQSPFKKSTHKRGKIKKYYWWGLI